MSLNHPSNVLKMSRLSLFAALALTFLAELLIPSPFFGDEGTPNQEREGNPSQKNIASGDLQKETPSPRRSRRTYDQRDLNSPRRLDLQVEVVEALIKGKGMERMLKQMEVSEEDIQTILEIEEEAEKSLKAIETQHAKLRKDEDGEYYEIPAFPEDHAAWVEGIEQELFSIFGDDRSAVISRIIAQKDNDEQTGLYFRKIRVLEKPERTVIKESVFNEQNHLIDEDYTIYRGINENRWDRLLSPETTPSSE